MPSTRLLAWRGGGVGFFAKRTAFKPPPNWPYYGIYRTEGDIVKADDLLVCQRRMNYHPGANVRFEMDRVIFFLKANCDGTVIITREKADVDTENTLMQKFYGYRDFRDIYKLTFNIVPRRMSNSFKLVDEV